MEMGKTQGRAGLGVEIGNLFLGMLSLRCPLDIQGKMPNEQPSRQDWRLKVSGLGIESQTEWALLWRVRRRKTSREEPGACKRTDNRLRGTSKGPEGEQPAGEGRTQSQRRGCGPEANCYQQATYAKDCWQWGRWWLWQEVKVFFFGWGVGDAPECSVFWRKWTEKAQRECKLTVSLSLATNWSREKGGSCRGCGAQGGFVFVLRWEILQHIWVLMRIK